MADVPRRNVWRRAGGEAVKITDWTAEGDGYLGCYTLCVVKDDGESFSVTATRHGQQWRIFAAPTTTTTLDLRQVIIDTFGGWV